MRRRRCSCIEMRQAQSTTCELIFGPITADSVCSVWTVGVCPANVVVCKSLFLITGLSAPSQTNCRSHVSMYNHAKIAGLPTIEQSSTSVYRSHHQHLTISFPQHVCQSRSRPVRRTFGTWSAVDDPEGATEPCLHTIIPSCVSRRCAFPSHLQSRYTSFSATPVVNDWCFKHMPYQPGPTKSPPTGIRITCLSADVIAQC